MSNCHNLPAIHIPTRHLCLLDSNPQLTDQSQNRSDIEVDESSTHYKMIELSMHSKNSITSFPNLLSNYITSSLGRAYISETTPASTSQSTGPTASQTKSPTLGVIAQSGSLHEPPSGLEAQFGQQVCKLQKFLYGLQQSPKAWFDRFGAFVKF
ncbi:reverse transcriptase [Cucumis melo var. makuwa]|uniref:Reverse transcriptase n=1 Tax=Cucumis melo var. makuwa TaxID=1194695 RepID=A0A5A7UYF7_CUCMM|nr:reverse transcriptase [Cucumis melo var. makuwa]TYK19287.1 reverse transcriptase [Cucumis melo var. makuwa]